jgi:hypothetical protein
VRRREITQGIPETVVAIVAGERRNVLRQPKKQPHMGVYYFFNDYNRWITMAFIEQVPAANSILMEF